MKPKPVHEKVIAVKIPAALDRAVEKEAARRGVMKREIIISALRAFLETFYA